MKHPDLKLLVNVFKKYPEIQAVYLFGSAGSNNMHEESDIDLMVIPGTNSLRKQKLSMLTDLAKNGFCDVDLGFFDPNDIVLQYESVRQNRVVYQAPGFNKGEIYSRIVRKYLDFYPYLTIQRKAYKKRILNGKS